MQSQDSFLADLSAVVDESGLILDTTQKAPYLKEWRGRFVSDCRAVVLPTSVDQVSAVLRLCHAAEVSVVPLGGNTGLVGGGVAGPEQIILSLERMNAIRAVDPVEKTLQVEAGCTLAQVQNTAQDAGFFFPLSIVPRERAQIGGLIATNAGGTNVLRYGNMREQLCGIEAVLADGQILSDMAALKKDNTGYDLVQLLAGSEGTLAILTAATLKLAAEPQSRMTAWVGVHDLASAIRLYRQVHDQFPGLSACELIPTFARELVERHIPDVAALEIVSTQYALLFEVESVESWSGASASPIAQHLNDLLDELDVEASARMITTDAAVGQAIWVIRKAIPAAQTAEGASLKHDISVPLQAMPTLFEKGAELIQQQVPGARLCAFGHLGDGNLHFNISQPEGNAGALQEKGPALQQSIFDLVVSLGGSFAAEHGIGLLKVDEMRKYKSAAEMEVMRRIKQALDPKGILNPGKLLQP